ncbi:hypothetical protein FM104_12885 [Microbacterium esteraromaticum]|uniref:Uncharacterized protein n=1 Tax=Microbacterium esteraromaticum TaxID=57043 RepID=A0A1R4KI41_9MICO|nr:hypothetical protein [Microbacterium esteraromaticum]SJN43733.1 hypothetical protein FM104_12885 [Microbacterium esteraromaticum]
MGRIKDLTIRFTERVNEDADDIGAYFHSRKGMWFSIVAVVGISGAMLFALGVNIVGMVQGS